MKQILIAICLLTLVTAGVSLSYPSPQGTDACVNGQYIVMDATNKRYRCQSGPLIYRATGVNLNSAVTDVATISGLPSKYIVRRFTVDNPSTSLAISVATLDLRTAASGAGTAIVSGQLVTALIGATKFADMTLAVTADTQTAASLYIRCVLAHGGTATVDITLEVSPLL